MISNTTIRIDFFTRLLSIKIIPKNLITFLFLKVSRIIAKNVSKNLLIYYYVIYKMDTFSFAPTHIKAPLFEYLKWYNFIDMIKETTENYYLFYLNKISSIINRMSDNVKHWFTSFLIFFSIYISITGILINFKEIFNVFSNKVIVCVLAYVVCLFGNVTCFFNVWKYLKIEKCFRELEKQATYKVVNSKYKFNETYDWSSILRNISIKKKIYHSMYRSFVIIASFIFIVVAILVVSIFSIFLFIN